MSETDEDFREKIERSSIGTPGARELRATVSDEKAAELVAEAHRRSGELHGAGYESMILIEGSYFKQSDLPHILGNYMRTADQYARDAKEAHLKLMRGPSESEIVTRFGSLSIAAIHRILNAGADAIRERVADGVFE